MSDDRSGGGGGRLDFTSNGQASAGEEGERFPCTLCVSEGLHAYQQQCHMYASRNGEKGEGCRQRVCACVVLVGVEGRLKGGVLVLMYLIPVSVSAVMVTRIS